MHVYYNYNYFWQQIEIISVGYVEQWNKEKLVWEEEILLASEIISRLGRNFIF